MVSSLTAMAAEYKAGVAAKVITPPEPIYMSGYASRTHPSEGVVMDLKAKALALEDAKGVRAVVVTADVIGYPRSFTDPLAARILKAYGISRSNLVFNASHTHTGPLIGENLEIMFELSPQEQGVVNRYARKLADDIFTVVGAALADLQPASLSLGHGRATFGVNRRRPTPKGYQINVNPEGPTDPDVPVLKITTPDGKLRAVLFGYACHNTTMTGEHCRLSGDYAGFAQAEIERANPGATAMFLELCGADQNPNPRSTVELATQHGTTLGAEVNRVLGGAFAPVRGRIKGAYQVVDLAFAYHTRAKFEELLKDANKWKVRNARRQLAFYDQRRPLRSYPYPVQAIAIGKDFTLLALGGEVVVDYSLRAKKTFGDKNLVVAGYSNDVMAYIPSARVLKEGGYEANDSMTYYGMPGPWQDDVEDRVFGAIEKVMKRVGRSRI
ncbi:MAG: neutral/alkaline non-lysosomal ceramidase N-terminal domain-containing protein [Bryobacteraceae bacterium]